MENVFVRWFVSIALSTVSCVFATDEWSGALHAVLRGKLVQKHFQAPKIIQNPPFGWFVELDAPSQQQISNLFENLSDVEKAIYDDIDLQCIRLLTYSFAIREWAHEHDGTQVTFTGEIVEPDAFGKLRAFNFHPEEVVPAITEKEHALACLALDQNAWTPSTTPDWVNEELLDESLILPDDEPEQLVTMTGVLHLQIFNSNPEAGPIENGGQPTYHWIVKLTPESFETACSTPVRASFQTPASIRSSNNCDEMELTGDYDEEWLCDHEGQTVSVQGYLWHAHTGHHHIPVMMDTDPWFK